MLPSTFQKSPVLKNRKVAAVDDDPNILSTIGMMMRSAGIESVLIDNPADALERLPDILPDLILLDYMMPGMNGAELYDRMTSDPRHQYVFQIPVVMLTAKTDNYEEQQSLFRKGISAYLLKPFGFGELINVISNVLTLQEVKNENRRLSEELLGAKNYLQSLFNSIDDCISVQTTDYRIQSYNRSTAERFLNNAAADSDDHPAIGRNSRDLCYKNFFNRESPCSFCGASEMIKTGKPQFTESLNPVAGQTIQLSFFPIRDAEGQITSFIETIRDITAKRKLEAQLAESVKMAGIGSLAMGVAHEINNPLCVILGFAQSLIKSMPADDPAVEDLKIIEEESQRCAGIVQDLLMYAKPGPVNKRKTDINEIIRNSLALLRHPIQKKEIEIIENQADDFPKLNADPKKIQQVLINILLNAIDSVSSGGRIQVSVRSQVQEGMIGIIIEDNGCGIDDALLPRIFDPFVTTKSGQGTGLGLSICKTIISDHGGDIDVRSRKNKGTAVTITLPVEG